MTGDTTTIEQLVGPESEAEREQRTSYLELFFDLVFVYAITQVTTLISDAPTAAGFARGALVLWLAWWAWGGYAWMTNAISIESRGVRIAFLGVTLGCLVVALGVPGAYGGEGLWFAIPYALVRAAHVALYLWGLRGAGDHQAAVRKLAPWFLVAPAVVLAGGFCEGNTRVWVWLVAVAIDVVGALNVANARFMVSASHFAERYALFIIIALGESIVAIGIGAAETPRNTLFAVAVAIAFSGVAVLWWAYFDFLSLGAERALTRFPIDQRGPIARDIYSFFHYPFVLGIIFFAVGAKKTLTHPDAPLSTAGRWALGLGAAVYMLGSVVGRMRAIRAFAWERAIAAAAALIAVSVLDRLDAVWLLAVVTVILAVMVAVESARLREVRRGLIAHEF